MPNHTADHQPELLTITEAAELRAPVATLRYWRHRNTGPRSFRLGRRVLYRRDDLRAWIDAQHDRASRPSAPRRTASDTSDVQAQDQIDGDLGQREATRSA